MYLVRVLFREHRGVDKFELKEEAVDVPDPFLEPSCSVTVERYAFDLRFSHYSISFRIFLPQFGQQGVLLSLLNLGGSGSYLHSLQYG